MPRALALKASVSGAVAGLGGGLLSLGGGTLLIPLLLGWLRVSPLHARGTAIAVSLVSAATGAWVYAGQGMVRWDVVLWVGVPALVLTPVAARWSAGWPAAGIRRAFGGVVIVGGAILMLKDVLPSGPTIPAHGEIAFLLFVGVMEGLVAGIVGISGGPVLAPLFVLGLGMPQQLAQGCSLAARLPAVLAGTWENAREGNVRVDLVAWAVVGASGGAWLGSHLALGVPEFTLRLVFGLFLIGLGLHYWRVPAPGVEGTGGRS